MVPTRAPAERTEFAVVGAGIVGLSAARALRRRGHEVVVVERAAVGHDRGGSKGASRVFRLGYDDPLYVRMADGSRSLWADLEREAGRPLLRPTPQLSFGPGLDRLLAAMHEAGAPARPIAADEARAAFPDLTVPGAALLEPESAVIDAPGTLTALRASVGDALREGVHVTRVEDDGTQVRIDAAPLVLEADAAVVCAGPWSAALLGSLAPTEMSATLEHVAYFRHRAGPLPTMPIFIEHGAPAVYGLPTESLGCYKLAFHHAGPAVDPDEIRAPEPEQVEMLVHAARRWLPAFDDTPVGVETCVYDNTPDEDFVLDRHGRIVIGAGTSGHGFKFGPLLGELLADLATGAKPSVDLSRFSLGRPTIAGAA